MQYSDNIIPIGGLNLDDDPRHLEPTDYVYCRNAHIATGQNQGDHGLLQSLRSTLETEFPVIGSSSWYQITNLGVAIDEELDMAYILSQISDSTAGKRFVITKHDILDGTMKTIMDVDADVWNIVYRNDINWKFFNPRVVDGKVVWTDNENDIRMVDLAKIEATTDAGIDRAVILFNYSNAGFPGYAADVLVFYLDTVYRVLQNTQYQGDYPPDAPLYYDPISTVESIYLDPVDPNNFTLAALPPLIAPTAIYYPDSNTKINNMRGRTWQFSYRYVYMDYRRSTYAPPSEVPPPSQDETINGEQNPDTTHNNSIKVTVNSGNEEVRSIQIIARNSDDPATWFLIHEIYIFTDAKTRLYGAGIPITIIFNNDTAKRAVNVTEVYTPFSYVPIKAKHMELIEGNRLVFANISEVYARIGTIMSATLSWEDLAAISLQETRLSARDVATTADPVKWTWWWRFTLPSINPGAVTFRLSMQQGFGEPTNTIEYVYDGIAAYPSTVITGLQNAMEIQWPNSVEPCSGLVTPEPTEFQFCGFEVVMPKLDFSVPYIGWFVDFVYVKGSITSTTKYPSLKTGTTHSWGAIYRDTVGRLSPVVGDLQLYIPFVTENDTATVGKRPQISFTLNHLPPDWADSYEIVYAGNKSIAWWLHLIGYNFAWGKKDHDDPSNDSANLLTNTFRMRIGAAQSNTRDILQNWSVEDYSWEKGDRMRIFGKVTGTGTVTEIIDYIYDVEVTGIFTDTDYNKAIDPTPSVPDDETVQEWVYFKKDENSLFNPGLSGAFFWEDVLFVEIYRPLASESGLYFTTGMTFEVGTDVYGNKYHKGDVNQVLNASGEPTTPAQIYNTSHDAWKYIRNFRNLIQSDTLRIWSESQFASDYYITNELDSRGNPIPDIDSQQQNDLAKRMRHGGAISIGSQLNFLADFQFDDFLDLDDSNGPIEGIRLVGFVLKAVQYTKVTSVYISRQESFSASGDPQYLFTDKVFGSARPAMQNWGSSHPSSIMVHNRHLYFWDQSEGLVIRDAANGQEPVSEYKMRQHFKDLARIMDGYSKETQSVFFAYSEETDELLCLFGQSAGTKDMWRFSERDNRWKGHITPQFVRNVIYWMGHRLFTTYNRYLYQWWAGADYGNITGVQREGEFDFYSRAEPLKVKTFDAIATYMTGGAPDYTEAQIIEDKATAAAGEMETSMYAVNTEQREGVYYTQILRDKNTPGPGTEDEKLLGGRRMRGIYMKFRLKLTGAILKTVSNIRVFSTPSERSG